MIEAKNTQGNVHHSQLLLKIEVGNGTVEIQIARASLQPNRFQTPGHERGICRFGRSAERSSCETYVQLPDRRRFVTVDAYLWSAPWSPKVKIVDYHESARIEQTSLLDDQGFIYVSDAQFAVFSQDQMPSIAAFAHRVPNPILFQEFHEHGVFLYEWDGQKYRLGKKFSVPKEILHIEAFTLLTPKVTGEHFPIGVLAAREAARCGPIFF
jgi:hypothetical protein